MSFLRAEKVGKTYANGFRALTDIDLAIEKGSFTVILGPSGAGKSTLLRALNGLDPATEGRIQVDGESLGRSRRLRGKIGMVFQHFNLVDRLNAMTNVLAGRLAHRHWAQSTFYLFPKSDYEIAHEALARVNLVDKAWERVDRLSGGQQQRVGIARALAQRPALILADEPVASLDPISSEEVLALLKSIARTDGITVIANLHQVEWAQKFADRVIGLNAGRIVFEGRPSELLPAVLGRIYASPAPQEAMVRDVALAYG